MLLAGITDGFAHLRMHVIGRDDDRSQRGKRLAVPGVQLLESSLRTVFHVHSKSAFESSAQIGTEAERADGVVVGAKGAEGRLLLVGGYEEISERQKRVGVSHRLPQAACWLRRSAISRRVLRNARAMIVAVGFVAPEVGNVLASMM